MAGRFDILVKFYPMASLTIFEGGVKFSTFLFIGGFRSNSVCKVFVFLSVNLCKKNFNFSHFFDFKGGGP